MCPNSQLGCQAHVFSGGCTRCCNALPRFFFQDQEHLPSFVDTGCWWLRAEFPSTLPHPGATFNWVKLPAQGYTFSHFLSLCGDWSSYPTSGHLKFIPAAEVPTSLAENFAATALQPNLSFCALLWSSSHTDLGPGGSSVKTSAGKFLSKSDLQRNWPKTINVLIKKPVLSHYEIFGGNRIRKEKYRSHLTLIT